MISFEELIKVGLHYGHQCYRWSPKMAPYIWGDRNGIHLIDISKTAQALEKAGKFLESVAAEGKPILWVGTKKVARKKIAEVGTELNQPYVDARWVGGMLTNFSQVKKSVTKLLHFEDILDRSDDAQYTKKERNHYQKVTDRLTNTVGGIKKLAWPVGAIVVIDAKKEGTALKEAEQSGVLSVALVDTNSDPSLVNYVIPGNDDSAKSVHFVLDYLAARVKAGIAKAHEAAEKAREEATAKKEAAKAEKEKASDKREAAPAKEEKKVAAPAKETTKQPAAALEPKKAVPKKATPVVKKKSTVSKTTSGDKKNK